MRDWLDKSRLLARSETVISSGLLSLFEQRSFWKLLRSGDLNPLHSHLTAKVELEFTTRCNLGCIYCFSRDPRHHGIDLDLGHLDQLAASLARRKVLAVGVSGFGETTVVEGWHEACTRLLDSGSSLFITTNLARELNEAEARILARFLIIQVSCDSVNPEVFRKLRRGGDLKTLLYNMARIRSAAVRYGMRAPVFWWNIVVCDQTLSHLEESVSFGLACGVKHFNFMNMYKPPVQQTIARPVSELSYSEREQCLGILERVFRKIRKERGSFVSGSLIQEIKRGLGQEPSSNAFGNSDDVKSRPGIDFTRNCLDPWLYLKVGADGGVRPCCIANEPLGFLGNGAKLDDFFNCTKAIEYRESILTGRLKSECLTCNIREWTDLNTVRLKAYLLSIGSWLPRLLHEWGLLVPLLHTWRR